MARFLFENLEIALNVNFNKKSAVNIKFLIAIIKAFFISVQKIQLFDLKYLYKRLLMSQLYLHILQINVCLIIFAVK